MPDHGLLGIIIAMTGLAITFCLLNISNVLEKILEVLQ